MAAASTSTSPPRTPIDPRTAAITNARKSGTPPSDDSYIEDLSFDYVFDENGNMQRISKGSSKPSPQTYTPPTPPDDIEPKDLKKPPSPISLNSPIGRSSLSRSESAFPALETVVSPTGEKPERPARSFGRTTSGPVLSSVPSYAAPTASSAAKPRTAPRRVTLDEVPERDLAVASSRSRQALDSHLHTHQDEKENISESDEHPYQIGAAGKRRHSPPLTSRSSTRPALRTTYTASSGSRQLIDGVQRAAHARPVVSTQNRAGRMIKSISTSSASSKQSSSTLDRYHDTDLSENEYNPPSSALSNYDDRNSPVGISPAGLESDAREDAESPAPGSGSNAMPGRQKNLVVGGAAAAGSLHQSLSNRPRRSASLSEGLMHDDYQLQVQQPYGNGHSRPGTSLGMSTIAENPDGARRVTMKEREQQEAEILSDCEKYIREHEVEQQEPGPQARQSPSPTHLGVHQARLAIGHRRQESDTVKSAVPSGVGSPTVGNHLTRVPSKSGHGRLSPPSTRTPQDRISPPSRSQARVSPQGRISPSSVKGRLSPSSARPPVAKEPSRHRRSPTAPDAPTTSNMVSAGTSIAPSGKTWAASEREDEFSEGRERDRERERRAQLPSAPQASPPPPAYTTQPIPAPAPAVSSQPSLTQSVAPLPPMQSPRHIVVNKKAYARLDMIGKGGSSRVFRVMSQNNELYAIKRVSLDRTDNEMMSGYMNEIALLKRLEGNSRIIRLIDSEVRAGPGGSKGHLLLVMECGEIDLARLLQDQMKNPLNMVWVAYYWQQMLQAVHVIHEEKIVHSDLKPANFVLVRGQLKLIDFGIANAIANDTTNIQRDHQVGTINYMSPEAIELLDGMRRLKVGRPSDVWSLGVILYQMIYGQPPFQHLPFLQKMRAIPDHNHVIEFPEYSIPTLPASKSANGDQISPPTKLEHLKRRVRDDVIDSMKKCLTRNSRERATIPQLLEHSWLSMKESELNAKPRLASDETIINPYYMRQLLSYGIKLGATQGESMDPDALLREAERLVAELKALQP
ncbi:Serine/threonine-protein kinase mph1 [Leucoagaricus sp. SymC.cos]|nr:Serine/threonine-protein kinase mph1 [Leucoagaricus sp. SymC.cos]